LAALLAVSVPLAVVASAGASAARFEAEVRPVRWAELRYTYRAACPTPPSELRTVRLTHWGFDSRPHTGLIVVNRRVADQVVAVFRRLYAIRFPVRLMRPVSRYRGSDDRSMAADNTSGFNCRRVGRNGPWSQHAYGLAVDLNPLENPYLVGGEVQPPAGRRFLERTRRRPGMVVEGDAVVRAFADVGWKWGGRWTSSKDYQHFSTTGL
jgi:hypothetical protein